jgi:hypothetical protein
VSSCPVTPAVLFNALDVRERYGKGNVVRRGWADLRVPLRDIQEPRSHPIFVDIHLGGIVRVRPPTSIPDVLDLGRGPDPSEVFTHDLEFDSLHLIKSFLSAQRLRLSRSALVPQIFTR